MPISPRSTTSSSAPTRSTAGSVVQSSRSPTSRSRRRRGASSGWWSSGACRLRPPHEGQAEGAVLLLALLDGAARARALRLLCRAHAGLDGDPARVLAQRAALCLKNRGGRGAEPPLLGPRRRLRRPTSNRPVGGPWLSRAPDAMTE